MAEHERLLTALQRGGCLAPYRQGWGVWRNGDLRRACIGQLPEAVVAVLLADGKLGPAPGGGGRYVWRGPVRPLDKAGRPPPKTPHTVGVERAPRSAVDQVLDALPDGTGRGRAIAALNRLAADTERAGTAQSVTMRWDGAGKVEGGRGLGPAGLLESARRAEWRLSELRSHLAADDLALLVDLVVYGRSLPGIARSAGTGREAALTSLAASVARLAEAYDKMATA